MLPGPLIHNIACMRIYTKTGDSGKTGLIGGSRVAKNDARIAATGDVDELNAVLGTAVSALPSRASFRAIRADLERIQSDLFDLGAVISAPGTKKAAPLPKGLERSIDRMEKELPTLKNFILPGGSAAGASLHVARAVCRRAERTLLGVPAPGRPKGALIYLNRLSDFLFVAARRVNSLARKPETLWTGGSA